MSHDQVVAARRDVRAVEVHPQNKVSTLPMKPVGSTDVDVQGNRSMIHGACLHGNAGAGDFCENQRKVLEQEAQFGN